MQCHAEFNSRPGKAEQAFEAFVKASAKPENFNSYILCKASRSEGFLFYVPLVDKVAQRSRIVRSGSIVRATSPSGLMILILECLQY